MTEFKCPRCGGEYFGTQNIGKPDEFVVCHSDTNGGSLSLIRPDMTMRNPKELGQPCGWRGKREECFQEASK